MEAPQNPPVTGASAAVALVILLTILIAIPAYLLVGFGDGRPADGPQGSATIADSASAHQIALHRDASAASEIRRATADPIEESAISSRSDELRASTGTPWLVPVPATFRNHFAVISRLAAERGNTLPSDLELPESVWRQMQKQYEDYERRLEPYSQERYRIIAALTEQCAARGDYEELPTRHSTATEEDRRKLAAAHKAARTPTKPNQTIVRQGYGNVTRFIRIDAEADIRLAALYDAIGAETDALVVGISLAAAPYTSPTRGKQ